MWMWIWIGIGIGAALLVGCSSEGGSGAPDAGATTGDTAGSTPKTYGQPCATNTECETGTCLVNEYAPFGWCSATCEVEEAPCEADSKGNVGGFCVEYPEDFGSEPRRFCVPVCTDIFVCQGLTDLWEECQPPSWKGNLLYGSATGVRTCQSPSAHGKETIDPVTCAGWEDNFTKFQPQIGVCKAYCDYLVTCKEVPAAATYNQVCCAYGCALAMTEGEVVDVPYEKERKCYVQNFSSFQGTPMVCDAPIENCGKNPEDPSPQ